MSFFIGMAYCFKFCLKITVAYTIIEIGFSKSSVTNWKKGVVPNNATIKKVSNYFNVSVNYLLGNEGNVNISGNSLNGTYNQVGVQPQMNIKEQKLSLQEEELLSFFRKLSEVNKAKALVYIAELVEK